MGRPIKDRTGDRAGYLVAVRLGSYRHGQFQWVYLCDCGREREMCPQKAGITGHCGCQTSENHRRSSKSHGYVNHGIYHSWSCMKARCSNPNLPFYKNYGGRGIAVCDRWMDFKNFLEDMGPRPEGTTLDRIDNDGDYCPENCRWATRKDQQNNRRACRVLTVGDKSMSVTQWAETTGINSRTIQGRLRRGWSPEEAVLTPINKACRNKRCLASTE